MDYVLTGFSSEILGENEFALKFHTMLFGLLFFLHLPVLLKKLGVENKITYPFLTLLVWSPPLLGYSLEARPIMLCLFWGLIYIDQLRGFLSRPDRKNFVYMTISQFILVITTSLQPQIFIFISFLSTFVFFKKYKSIIKKVFLSNLLTAIYALPTIYYVVKFVGQTNQLAASWFHNFILLFNPYNALEVSRILTTSPYFFGALSGVIIFRLIYSFKVELGRNFKFYLFWCLAFYITYVVFYFLFVSWNYAFRYALLFVIPFLLAGILALQDFKNLLSKAQQKIFLATFFCFISIGAIRSYQLPVNYRISVLNRLNWRPLYDFLNKSLKDSDKVIRVSFGNIGEWRGGTWVGSRIYLEKKHRNKLIQVHRFFPEYGNTVYVDKSLDYQKSESGQLFIVIEKSRMHPDWYSRKELGFYQKAPLVYDTDELEVYRTSIDQNLYQTISGFLNWSVERFGEEHESSVAPLESLISLELKFGTKEKFIDLLERYKKVKPKNNWTKDGIRLDKSMILESRRKFLEKRLKHYNETGLRSGTD